jgi:hypothetical protein
MVQILPLQFGFETLQSALPRAREGAARRAYALDSGLGKNVDLMRARWIIALVAALTRPGSDPGRENLWSGV